MAKRGNQPTRAVQKLLELAQLRAEKCELKEAELTFREALGGAKSSADAPGLMEALAGLFRLAGEALDDAAIEKWDRELDSAMAAYPKQIPSMVWYCKGAVARQRERPILAQRYFHRFLRGVKPTGDVEEIAKGWLMLSVCLFQRGRFRRARWIAERLLADSKPTAETPYRGICGTAHLVLAYIEEKKKAYDHALRHYQRAHRFFLSEHNWYYHLYVLYGYARLARLQQNYSQAYWYLDLVDQACAGPEFGLLRKLVAREMISLEQDAVDLLIDSRKGIVRTREQSAIPLGKQYVLLQILEALSDAHGALAESDAVGAQGLSKGEIIERVWHEKYRPEQHDNKLYYNINRLRKLIEPDVRKPQYLLNWKEGYRLAPGLKIQWVGEHFNKSRG